MPVQRVAVFNSVQTELRGLLLEEGLLCLAHRAAVDVRVLALSVGGVRLFPRCLVIEQATISQAHVIDVKNLVLELGSEGVVW